jgi:TRAP-type C4-dicarboxylate transport system substrate-binding protein
LSLLLDRSKEEKLETMEEIGITIHEPDLGPFIEKAREAWPGLMQDIPNGLEIVERLTRSFS